MGAEKGNAWIGDCLSYYKDKQIEIKDNKIMGINVIPVLQLRLRMINMVLSMMIFQINRNI